MRRYTRSRSSKPPATGRITLTRPEREGGIDVGFAMAIYGRDARGNMVEIGDGLPPGEAHPAAWPTEQ